VRSLATLFSEKNSHCFEQQRFPHQEWNWCGAKDPIAGGDVNDFAISLPNGSRDYSSKYPYLRFQCHPVLVLAKIGLPYKIENIDTTERTELYV
jgi:hypothetical protein